MPWGSNAREAEALIRELKRLGVRAAMHEDNLEDPDSAHRIFDAAESQIGPVRALVNAHAHSTRGGLMDATIADFDRHLAINARGVFIMSAEFARRFKGPAGSGRIVNFTSGLPLAGEIAYAASKGAIEWITVSSAAELASRGITVNAINPGPNDTGWMPPPLKNKLPQRVRCTASAVPTTPQASSHFYAHRAPPGSPARSSNATAAGAPSSATNDAAHRDPRLRWCWQDYPCATARRAHRRALPGKRCSGFSRDAERSGASQRYQSSAGSIINTSGFRF
jgi:3-oxoacyl-[acyl-carrier protein] reductase